MIDPSLVAFGSLPFPNKPDLAVFLLLVIPSMAPGMEVPGGLQGSRSEALLQAITGASLDSWNCSLLPSKLASMVVAAVSSNEFHWKSRWIPSNGASMVVLLVIGSEPAFIFLLLALVSMLAYPNLFGTDKLCCCCCCFCFPFRQFFKSQNSKGKIEFLDVLDVLGYRARV